MRKWWISIGIGLFVILTVGRVGGIPVAHAAPITLTAITTGFNNPIGIDHHEPTNQVVMSVNYSSGSPHNFELVAADGTRTVFSSVSGFENEVKIATARDDGGGMSLGGFTPGELFVGTGVPGVIARISADGLTVMNPWVTLPGETGLMRGSLHVDRFGVFGGDLIAVTTRGGVWRITSSGTPTLLANLGPHLEGVTTVPADVPKYGPWSGKILIGAEGLGRIYTVDTAGASAFYTLGINPEDIDIIPAGQNFYGVDFSGRTLGGAPASEFAAIVGDVLIAQEFPGILWHVAWNGSAFVKEEIARVRQWEHVTFSTAGIVEIPPIPTDTTPPRCEVIGVNIAHAAPPTNLLVEVEDTGSGLDAINVLVASNATVNIPAFGVGTNAVVQVVADKINESKRARVEIQAIDVEGNSSTCDPVLATLTRDSRTLPLTGIAPKERYLTVSPNGDGPASSMVMANVNGTWFQFGVDQQSVTIDLGSAMTNGSDNTVTLWASSDTTILLADAVPKNATISAAVRPWWHSAWSQAPVVAGG